jgi:DNA-binding transcriptional regulator YhcF (GntR family)
VLLQYDGRVPRALDVQVDRGLGVPIGAQLAVKLRRLIEDGTLRPGDRLPSIRELAPSAGVNVNTVRAVYRRLEQEGLIATEHGRGTFVVDEAAARRRLRDDIAALERRLVQHKAMAPPADQPTSAPRSALLTARELEEVRDMLLARLEELDAARAEVLGRLEELKRWGERQEAQSEEQPAEGDTAAAREAAPDAALLRRLQGPLTA